MYCNYTQEQKELILKIYKETEMGLFDCVRALVQNDYDYNKALEYLEEKRKTFHI